MLFILISIAGAVVGICVWVFVVEPLWVLGVLEWVTPGVVFRLRMGEAGKSNEREKERCRPKGTALQRRERETGQTEVPPLHSALDKEKDDGERKIVNTGWNLVGLTFDDGPHPVFTVQVLDILKSHDAKATFFLIGERARRYPELVARIKAEGHEIGNHYIRDGATFFHSDAEFVRNLLETRG